jgi:hypothetical protein
LENKTKGYKNHPQLIRFKSAPKPVYAINYYLKIIHQEATKRDYNFDSSKFDHSAKASKIKVTQGQMDYELKHLLNKLKTRDIAQYKAVIKNSTVITHPLFTVLIGDVHDWEIVSTKT